MLRDCSQGAELVEEFFKNDCISRVISCAPYLKDEKGHGLAYHRAFEKIVSDLQMTTELFVSKEKKSELPTYWIPFFSPSCSKLTLAQRRIFEFSRLFKRLKNERFILFIESFNLIELAALTMAILIKRPLIKPWILLRYPKEMLPCRGKIHLCIFKILQRFSLSLFTDSELIKNSFNSLSLTVLPIPHTEMADSSTYPSQGEYGKIKMWWPGEPRVQKGLYEIQSLAAFSAPEFSLYLSSSANIEQSKMTIVRLKDSLSRGEFLKIFQEINIILLPYDRHFYRASTSGLFVEAVIGNKIPFVKDGTWLAEECKKFNLNELILNWSSPLILETIKLNIYNGNTINKLKVMREHYLNYHTPFTFSKIIKNYINEY